MTADLEELERARRFLAIDWADVARRRANKRRLAVGLPAWHFGLARPVPDCGDPPIG
jgi:hypothetical protein